MYIQKSLGLKFFGGEREVCDPDNCRDKFTPAGYQIKGSGHEGLLKLCSAATPNATNPDAFGGALIFWFVLDQGKMNTTLSKHDKTLSYIHLTWNSKIYTVMSDKTGC